MWSNSTFCSPILYLQQCCIYFVRYRCIIKKLVSRLYVKDQISLLVDWVCNLDRFWWENFVLLFVCLPKIFRKQRAKRFRVIFVWLWCCPCLVPRYLSLDENLRAMEGGKEITGLPMVPCESLPFTRVSRLPLSETIGATPIDQTCSKYISHIVWSLRSLIRRG